MQKIIGISGKKQSGKDTALAGLIVTLGWKRISVIRFADYLKQIFEDCLGIRDFSTEESKQKKLPGGMTLRSALQELGTDVMRRFDPDCWIRPWKKAVDECDKEYIVVPDVRFPNEIKAVQNRGGIVIHLTRCVIKDNHISETLLDNLVAGPQPYSGIVVIDNRDMSILYQWHAVAKILKDMKWI